MLRLAMACSAWLLLVAFAPAEESTESASALELKSLRETVQLQSQQLEKISQQLDDVLRRLGMKSGQTAAAATKAEIVASVETPAPPKAVAMEGQKTHVVQKGETLTAIAHQYGVTVAELQAANHITDGRRLQIEQNLIIPDSKAQSSAPPAPPTAQPTAQPTAR